MKKISKNGIKSRIVRLDDGTIYSIRPKNIFSSHSVSEDARVFSEERAKELLRIEKSYYLLKQIGASE